MVKRVSNRPRGHFKEVHNEDNFIWFALYYKKEIYAYIGIDVAGSFGSGHIEMIKWSHNVAKMLKIDWEEIKFICNSYGVKRILASNRDVEDKRWPKFIKLLGFPKPTSILVSEQEI
jgi:hypothetical protein